MTMILVPILVFVMKGTQAMIVAVRYRKKPAEIQQTQRCLGLSFMCHIYILCSVLYIDFKSLPL